LGYTVDAMLRLSGTPLEAKATRGGYAKPKRRGCPYPSDEKYS